MSTFYDSKNDKKGEISERVISGWDGIRDGLITAGSYAGSAALDIPFFMVASPSSQKALSSDYRDMYWDSIREKDKK